MSVLTWPSSLPRPLRSGYQAQNADPRLRKQADAGPPGFRRRYSSVARGLSLSVVLSRSEKAQFDRFYEQDTRHGSLPFWMPDPVTDGWPMLTESGAYVLTESGQPILLSKQLLCLFGDEPPVETIQGMSFTIGFSVWVMP